MSQKDLFIDNVEKGPGSSEPFGAGVNLHPSQEELFVGDFSFINDLTAQTSSQKKTGTSGSRYGMNPLYAILGVNILITVILAGVIWLRPVAVIGPSSVQAEQLPSPAQSEPISQAGSSVSEVKPQPEQGPAAQSHLTDDELAQLQQGVSLKMADAFYAAKHYAKASYVYQQISSNLSPTTVENEYLLDYLKLRISVCQQRQGEASGQNTYLNSAMQSRSAMVRGLASYYLATTHYQNHEYLLARRYAYQTAALLKAFEGILPARLEEDLYFMAAESLSRFVMGLYPGEFDLPGHLWSDSLGDIWPNDMDQSALCEVLTHAGQKISEGAGSPKIIYDTNRTIGTQWSVVCLQSPLEEVLVKVATQSGTGLTWKTIDTVIRSRPVTAYLLYVPQQYAAEVISGAAGLMWKYDGQNAVVINPETYDDFDSYRRYLIAESISIWQRFLLRYRGDHRTPNAHYVLGQMYHLDHQYAAGLGEYKLIQSHFSHNPLAPFAYLEASKIRTIMKDYAGASTDLSEMLLQYPDCKAADQATLYLAQATLESGQTAHASDLFKKVFQMDLNRPGKIDAAYGLGRCAYLQKDWAAVREWLGRAMELMTDQEDSRIVSMCSMLGTAYIELGQYQQASQALRIALGSKLSNRDYVQIIRELAEAEMRQSNYLGALNILESIPMDRLNQADSCEILITRSRVLRSIDAADAAVSLLRRKIEFIADSQLRAWLTLELAECYFIQGDYALARRELNDVMADMQDSYRAQQAGLLLAKISEQLNQPQQAEQICQTILNNSQLDSAIRIETFEILGRIYTSQKEYDKAALAFAGVGPQEDRQ
ncbi:MAG: tetratricopeptide repeat protein [Sedimentisphaerales bacterium]|nr:tetratricopeptide repeat protein [Sedimentisphaerales bacterium]